MPVQLIKALILASLALALPAASGKTKPSPAPVRSLLMNEAQLWRANPILQNWAKRLSPLGKPAGDGAIGLNVKFPEKVLVEHQAQGWNWIRAGVALGNGFIVDRGIMAFEWAFARMKDDGSFGESKTIEITHFLGLYARAVLLLQSTTGMTDRAGRLERLKPRLEISLRSPRSLMGERRWDRAEKETWMTSQRVQAAAAAYWIGRLLVNPALQKTSQVWLDDALKRQEVGGLFPASGIPAKAKASVKAQLEALDALQGLAWADTQYSIRLRDPIKLGFRWIEMNKVPVTGSPLALATYAAWTKDSFATRTSQNLLKQ